MLFFKILVPAIIVALAGYAVHRLLRYNHSDEVPETEQTTDPLERVLAILSIVKEGSPHHVILSDKKFILESYLGMTSRGLAWTDTKKQYIVAKVNNDGSYTSLLPDTNGKVWTDEELVKEILRITEGLPIIIHRKEI